MNKIFFKLYLLSFFLMTDFIMFAQPGDDDGTGTLEGEDPPATPINGKIIWLAIAAVFYGWYVYNKNRKRA